eukprot:scaffold744_cov111-Isochrysis_galbana.AAC.5
MGGGRGAGEDTKIPSVAVGEETEGCVSGACVQGWEGKCLKGSGSGRAVWRRVTSKGERRRSWCRRGCRARELAPHPHRLYVLARLLTPPKGVWEGPRAIVHLPRNTRCRFLSPPPCAFLASSPRAWEVCFKEGGLSCGPRQPLPVRPRSFAPHRVRRLRPRPPWRGPSRRRSRQARSPPAFLRRARRSRGAHSQRTRPRGPRSHRCPRGAHPPPVRMLSQTMPRHVDSRARARASPPTRRTPHRLGRQANFSFCSAWEWDGGGGGGTIPRV